MDDRLESVGIFRDPHTALSWVGHERVVADVAEYHAVVLLKDLGGLWEVRVGDVLRHSLYLAAALPKRGREVRSRVPDLIDERV